MALKPPHTTRPAVLCRLWAVTLTVVRVKSMPRIGVDEDFDVLVVLFQRRLKLAYVLGCRAFILLAKQAEEGALDVFGHIKTAYRRLVLVGAARRAIPGHGGPYILVICGILYCSA